MKAVVIGAGVAGTTAALELKKLDRRSEVVLLEATKYPEYSHCGMPFSLEGMFPPESLISHPAEFYKRAGIDLRLNAKVKKIKPKERKVILEGKEEGYDYLIIATGGKAFVPPIEGIDKEGVAGLNVMDELKELLRLSKKSKRAVVIGAGLIGLETAVALESLGIEVTVVEMLNQIIPIIDKDMAEYAQRHMESRGVEFKLEKKVERILGKGNVEGVMVSGEKIGCDLVVLATGTLANSGLAKDAGLKAGPFGIEVDEYLRTSDERIYAIGDSIQVKDFFCRKSSAARLSSIALIQGRVAAANIAGRKKRFDGGLNSTVTKLFDLEVGRVGLDSNLAGCLGVEVQSSKFKGASRIEYYPDKKDVVVKIIFDKRGKVLGFQSVGPDSFGRVAALAIGIQKGVTLEDLTKVEFPFAPPISPAIEPIHVAAELGLRRLK
ncbi:MAG: FAD-dependent oxidoreductase [archaeon]